jgi:pyrrolidone-carboxylate peptidase
MLKKTILSIIVVLALMVTLGGVGFAWDSEGHPLKILLVGYGWYAGIPAGQINNAETIARSLDNVMIEARDAKGRVVAHGKVTSLIVPVTWDGAFPPVKAAIKSLKPDIVVGLGTYPGETGFEPEPFASNFEQGCDANPSNPSQIVCKNGPIDTIGPPFRSGNLPYDKIVIAMSKAGIPANKGGETGYVRPGNPQGWCDYPQCPHPPGYIPGTNPEGDPQPSATPGWYLCNFMTYNLDWYMEENHLKRQIMYGFIHVPTRAEYAAKDPSLLVKTNPDYEKYITEWAMPSMEMSRMIEGIQTALEECVRAKAGH